LPLSSNQRVGSSNLSGRTTYLASVSLSREVLILGTALEFGCN
jgi:hypothetical protein